MVDPVALVPVVLDPVTVRNMQHNGTHQGFYHIERQYIVNSLQSVMSMILMMLDLVVNRWRRLAYTSTCRVLL